MKVKQEKKKMNKNDDKRRKLESLKNMYFNRFLMIRYFLAIFLFANFYWLCISWGNWTSFIAGGLFILTILPAFEMFKMMGNPNPTVKWTTLFFRVQIAICAGVSVSMFFMPVNEILPVLTNAALSRSIGICIFVIGFVMCLLAIRRLDKIDTKTDKQYQRIKQYEKALRLHL